MQDVADHRVGRLPGEREPSGQQLEQADAEGPNVASTIDVGRALRLLWAHVSGRADRATRVGVARLVPREDLADAEVEHLHGDLSAAGLGVEEDVRGLEITVHDPERVRGDQRARDADADLDRVRLGAGARALEAILEGLAVEDRHDQERSAVLELGDVEDLDDVPVLDAPARPSLAQDARARLGRLVVFGEDLEGDPAVGQGVYGLPDRSHRPTAQDANDAVLRRDERSRLQIHHTDSTRPRPLVTASCGRRRPRGTRWGTGRTPCTRCTPA